MKTILVLAVAFAAVAVVSSFIHHHHHHHSSEEVSATETTEQTGGHHHKKHGGHHHHKKHGGHHHHKKHHWMCKGEAVKKNDDLIKAKKECHQEFKEAKESDVQDRQRGRVCKSLCSGKKVGFFDEEGQIVQSKVDELVESMIVNTEAQTEIKERSAECATNSSEALTGGPSDVKCSNYKPYLKCLWMSAMEVCVKNFNAEDFE